MGEAALDITTTTPRQRFVSLSLSYLNILYTLLYNTNIITHYPMFQCIPKCILCGHKITIIILASMSCLPQAHTHTSNSKYYDRFTTHRNRSFLRFNTHSNVSLRNDDLSVPNFHNDTDMNRGDAAKHINFGYPGNFLQNKKNSFYSGVKAEDEIFKITLNYSYIAQDDVRVDSFRSSSICLRYYQTHWLRDSKNCSMFFVCSKNRIAALLTCPRQYVWSNRVTNCVPANSRWDDCRFNKDATLVRKTTETNVNEHRHDTNPSTTESHRTLTVTANEKLQHQKQRHSINHQRSKRRRLGYRGRGSTQGKSSSIRNQGTGGYVIQWLHNNLNSRITKRRKSLRANPRQRKRYIVPKMESVPEESKAEIKIKEKGSKSGPNYIDTNLSRWYPDETSATPISDITIIPNIKKKIRFRKLRKRKRRKQRRIEHKFRFSEPIKKENMITNSKTQFYSKSVTNTTERFIEKVQEKYPDSGREGTTVDTVVTKWWMTSETPVTDRSGPRQNPPSRPVVVDNTTLPSIVEAMSSSQAIHVFIPECGVSASPMIVGGLPVQHDRWPWVVSLQPTWLSRHMCGATLIHPQWLITAAHCMAEPDLNHAEDWRVIFENVNTSSQVDFIVQHPSFVNGDNYPNDIAMLRLKYPADVTGFHIRHACLPSQDWNKDEWEKCWIMGWGEAKEDTVSDLKELEVNIWKNSECSARWGWKRILNSHICVGTGDSGACNGDSGGPLICRRKGYHFLAGVTSWGVHGCQTNGYPGVFVNVASYRQWINEVIQNDTM